MASIQFYVNVIFYIIVTPYTVNTHNMYININRTRVNVREEM